MSTQLATRISEAAVDLADLAARIDAMDPQEAGSCYDRAQDIKRLAREFADFIEAALLDYVESGREPVVNRGGELHRLYAKEDKTIKCRDPVALHAALLEQHGPEVAAQALASGAWKPAACKPLLGNEWGNHFEVIQKPKLAEGGSPRRILAVARNPEKDD